MSADRARTALVLLVAALVGPGILPAQRDISGKTWTQWDPHWKVTYLMGFYAGRKAEAALFRQAEKDYPRWDPTQYEPAKVKRYKTDRKEFVARDLKYDFKTMRTLLDVFYTHPDNLLIPLPEALRIVVLRAADQAERAEFLLQRERRQALKGK